MEREKNKVFLRFGRCRSLLHCAAHAVLLLHFVFLHFFFTYILGLLDGKPAVSFLSSNFSYVQAGNVNKHMFICMLAVEEEISFPPTYRYERGSRDTYVWQKQKATGVHFSNASSSLMSIHPLCCFLMPLILLILLGVCVCVCV